MSGLPGKVGFILLCALLLVGCVGNSGPVRLDPACRRTSNAVPDLSAVFAEAIDERGRLIPAGLARVRRRLDEQLLKMELYGPITSPESFPTDASRWAWWYNARAAWSMKLADLAGCSRQVSPAARARTFILNGRKMSLGEIDSILLAEARRSGDFRLAACAPGAWVNYAPMPQKPFAEEGFKQQLGQAINRLVLDERRFVVDVESRQVRIPPLLWACRDMVVSWYHRQYGPCDVSVTTALGVHLNSAARRRLEGVLGYAPVRQRVRAELAVPRRKVYFPGKVGPVEP